MKRISVILSIVFITIFLTSASLLKTQLQITVLDDAGNFQEGATVTLFENDEDYNANKSVMKPQKTDRKGRTKFVGVDPINYFILVEKDNKNNVLGGERTGELTEGKINKVNIIISE